MRLNVLQIQAKWAKEYGSVVKWFLGPTAVLLVTDIQEFVHITSKEAKVPKWTKFYDLLNTVSDHYFHHALQSRSKVPCAFAKKACDVVYMYQPAVLTPDLDLYLVSTLLH